MEQETAEEGVWPSATIHKPWKEQQNITVNSRAPFSALSLTYHHVITSSDQLGDSFGSSNMTHALQTSPTMPWSHDAKALLLDMTLRCLVAVASPARWQAHDRRVKKSEDPQ